MTSAMNFSKEAIRRCAFAPTRCSRNWSCG